MNRASLLDAAKAFLRVWIVSTLMLWIPGLLGWVHEVSEWAAQKGAPPFPDPTNLAFLFVAALTGAFPAIGMTILRLLESASGTSFLRPSGPPVNPPPNQVGAASPWLLLGAGVAVLGLVVLAATTADLLGVILIVAGLLVVIYAAVTGRRSSL